MNMETGELASKRFSFVFDEEMQAALEQHRKRLISRTRIRITRTAALKSLLTIGAEAVEERAQRSAD